MSLLKKIRESLGQLGYAVRRDRFSGPDRGPTTITVREVHPKPLSEQTIQSLQLAGADPAFIETAREQLRRAH